jgi:SAM-dependent methyltransferase
MSTADAIGPEPSYLLADQPAERGRLQRQALAWEPAGRTLLADLPAPPAARAVDLGCGALGWLRLLSEWVGPDGHVVGTDIDPSLLDTAQQFCREKDLEQVTLLRDDLFASDLEPASFDLVHARFQVAPLGRADEIVDTMLRLVRPGGLLILEDPVADSWRFHPPAPAADELVQHILEAFAHSGGCFDAGPENVQLLRRRGLTVTVRAAVLALPSDDPYLRLPLQFATSLRQSLADRLGNDRLDDLLARAEREIEEPTRWGISFTLVQAVARARTESR